MTTTRLTWPYQPAAATHETLLAWLDTAIQGVPFAHARVVLARRPGDAPDRWSPAFGRIDLAQDADVPRVECHPRGPVRFLQEAIPSAAFIERLRPALRGGPFVVAGEPVVAHGLAGPWEAYRHNSDWSEFGASWPCTVAAPSNGVERRPYLSEIIEDEDPATVFPDLEALLNHVAGIRRVYVPGGQDLRFSRIQIIQQDYRGRIDTFIVQKDRVSVEVTPKADPLLRLVGVISGDGGPRNIVEIGPSKHEFPLREPPQEVKLSLRVGDETLAEVWRDPRFERAQRLFASPSFDDWSRDDVEEEAVVDDGFAEAMLAKITAAIQRALREFFETPPKNEKEVQKAVDRVLRSAGIEFHREKERAPLGPTALIPDFTVPDADLAIEIKLAKHNLRDSKLIQQLSQDAGIYRTKWRNIIAIIYDPGGHIRNPEQLKTASLQLGINTIVIKH
ncbi:MAG: hypothetical protein HOW73_18190 [Polyangiaceae bacterium]|nr:hypothetical protein [Polyangiaceae bacterium]